MTHLVVLRGGTRLEVSDAAGAKLIEIVAKTLQRGSPVFVGDGLLLRVDDFQVIAPMDDFRSADKSQIKANVSMKREPKA